jgi:hypothetical protein
MWRKLEECPEKLSSSFFFFFLKKKKKKEKEKKRETRPMKWPTNASLTCQPRKGQAD